MSLKSILRPERGKITAVLSRGSADNKLQCYRLLFWTEPGRSCAFPLHHAIEKPGESSRHLLMRITLDFDVQTFVGNFSHVPKLLIGIDQDNAQLLFRQRMDSGSGFF